MVTIPEYQTARVSQLRSLLRIKLPGNVAQIDKFVLTKVRSQVVVMVRRHIQRKQRALLVQSKEHQVFELLDEISNFGAGYMDCFGSTSVFTPAHQAFVIFQNNDATVASRPLPLQPAGILA